MSLKCLWKVAELQNNMLLSFLSKNLLENNFKILINQFMYFKH